MPQIILYTQNDCPPCTFVKNYLIQNDIVYEERNIKKEQYRQQMMAHDAFSTPFILINDEPMYQVDLDLLNQKLGI